MTGLEVALLGSLQAELCHAVGGSLGSNGEDLFLVDGLGRPFCHTAFTGSGDDIRRLAAAYVARLRVLGKQGDRA
jgi:hypothetical protein